MDFRRLRSWSKKLGRRGENAAVSLLKAEGFSILTRNCRIGTAGELDIVARDGMTIVFVEVKTRYCKDPDTIPAPIDNLKLHQIKRIRRGAEAYMRALEDPPIKIRFDLIEVLAGRFFIRSLNHRKAFIPAHDQRRKRREEYPCPPKFF